MPQRSAPEFVVRLNNQVDSRFRVLNVHQSMGGQSLDTATLELDLANHGQHLADTALLDNLNGYVEISLQGGDAGINRALHFGWLSQAHFGLGNKGERLVITSKAEQFLFGRKTYGMMERDPISGQFVLNPVPIVFNPQIDKVVEPNMHSDTSGPFLYFLDPESVRTDAARKLHGLPMRWNLIDAIMYLCQHCNSNGFPIGNPNRLEVLGVVGDDPLMLQNSKVALGLSLPEALDHLLEPFSYTWAINYNGIGQRRIAVFRRGRGRKFTAKHQRAGESLDTSKSNSPSLDLTYSIGATSNYLDVRGDYIYIEGTFELKKGWDPSLDETGDFLLARDNANYQNDPKMQRVWRDFVLNESGEYTGLRPEITAPFDLGQFFSDELSGRAGEPEPDPKPPADPDDPGDDLPEEIRQPQPAAIGAGKPAGDLPVVPKRRHFHRCLTLGDDLAPFGEVNGCHVEFSLDEGETWEPISKLSDHNCCLLVRECGVRFDGHLVPQRLKVAGDRARVRITATIRCDLKIFSADDSNGASPLGYRNDELIDNGHRFHYRVVGKTSIFYAAVQDGSKKAKQVRDDADLVRYQRRVLDGWNMAELNGSIEIEGLDGEDYRVGDVITHVEGRSIGLEVTPNSADTHRFPQIIGISYDRQKQTRALSVKTFRNEHIR